MRIISGIWKGKPIAVPQEGTRPSTDKTRQALFNILQHVVEGAKVLDLYAGSGALALESLSRGAASATCVESHRSAVRVIQQNSRNLSCNSLQITQQEVDKFLTSSNLSDISLIFADPPYEKDFPSSHLRKALCHEALPKMMTDEAFFIAESPKKLSDDDLESLPNYWNLVSRRKYGKAHITILSFQSK